MSKYHELYGWMPRDIAEKIPEVDRKRMFIDFVLREPTNAGRYIVVATLTSLGVDFFNYLCEQIAEGMISEGENPTFDSVVESLKDLFVQFATDPNLMMEYIEEYDPDIEYNFNEESNICGDVTKEQLKDLEKAGYTVVPSFLDEEKKGKQPRDPKTGRFMKKK